VILINGEPREHIAATDRGLHYGDGVFETLAVRNGRPQLWHAHIERLLDGCSRLRIPQQDISLLSDEVAQVCEGQQQAVVKLIVTRGSGGRGYRFPDSPHPLRLVMRYPWPGYAIPDEGIRLRLCQTPVSCNPVLAGIKHLNRLEQVLARGEWSDEAIQEGVMLDSDGYVVEGTMSNLFGVRDGVLLTPDLGRCGVAGVMRRQVLALAKEQGIRCEQVRLRADELTAVDELFVTNSLIGIWPVARLEQTSYGDRPVCGRLMNALNTFLEHE
jgi:4-amino-4-deoxychorismate lyase